MCSSHDDEFVADSQWPVHKPSFDYVRCSCGRHSPIFFPATNPLNNKTINLHSRNAFQQCVYNCDNRIVANCSRLAAIKRFVFSAICTRSNQIYQVLRDTGCAKNVFILSCSFLRTKELVKCSLSNCNRCNHTDGVYGWPVLVIQCSAIAFFVGWNAYLDRNFLDLQFRRDFQCPVFEFAKLNMSRCFKAIYFWEVESPSRSAGSHQLESRVLSSRIALAAI